MRLVDRWSRRSSTCSEQHQAINHIYTSNMSASGQAAKETAAGGAGVGPSRRKWDIEEYTQKARERDRQDKERAEENAERLRKGECKGLQ